jgi:hypothetical protein
MMYTLEELLTKMGAPEAKEKGQMRWHYFDRASGESKNGSEAAQEMGGYAEVRLLDGGEALVAEMKQMRNVAVDDGAQGSEKLYSESLYLYARRSGNRYTVTKIAFDGEEYPNPRKSIIELGLSIFHARALDISILMVEQAFNRQDIVIPATEPAPLAKFASMVMPPQKEVKKEAWGVVVPFRPRAKAAGMSF